MRISNDFRKNPFCVAETNDEMNSTISSTEEIEIESCKVEPPLTSLLFHYSLEVIQCRICMDKTCTRSVHVRYTSSNTPGSRGGNRLGILTVDNFDHLLLDQTSTHITDISGLQFRDIFFA